MTQKPGYIKGLEPHNAPEPDHHEAETRTPGYAADSAHVSLKPSEPKQNFSAPLSVDRSVTETSGGISKTVLSVAGLLLLLMLSNELLTLWQRHWIAGSVGTILLIWVLFAGLRVWRQERRAVEEVARLKAEQDAVQQALQRGDLTTLKTALHPWCHRQAKVAPEQIAAFKAAAQSRSTAEEYWQLYKLMVLRPLDQQTDQLIQHYSLTTGTAVMVIPHAGLDSLVVLWRSRAMTQAIARTYGLEMTHLSTLKLFKQALITIVAVAGVETLAQEKLLSDGGDELINRMLGGVSQSLLTAHRTYRLGRLIQLACRP